MSRTRHALSAIIVGTLAFAAGCSNLDPIEAPAPVTGAADFSSYVALGTSVSMGFQSGGLVDQYQATSVPALIAAQTAANGGSFVQPLMADPGFPNLLTVTSLVPLQLGIRPGTPPTAPYVQRPADGYDNLSVSGAILPAVLTATTGTPYFDIVLQGQGTMMRQCLAQTPTFVTVELGATDAVRPLLAGGNPAAILPAPAFAALYDQILDSLQIEAPGAGLAVSNLPDVTHLPYATAVPIDVPFQLSPGGLTIQLRLSDAAGPLPNGSLILLPALPLIRSPSHYGFPPPAPPLPDSLVITLAERAAIETAVDGYNTAIASSAQAHGAAFVDAAALFDELYAHGVEVGGAHYTTAYLSGGLFSVDGIHPSSLGSGLLANAFIEAINAKYGAHVAQVNLAGLTAPPLP